MSQNCEPVKLFISYSHKDEDLRDELDVHLANLKRQGKITTWHDRVIEAGAEWDSEIKDHLESAELILLLVSPRFMASGYCYHLEMQRAIALHDTKKARAIPIILKPVDWEDAPFSKLQALPEGGKPVTKWGDRNEAFLSVVRGIRRAVESLRLKRASVNPQNSQVQNPNDAEDPDTNPIEPLDPFITGTPILHPRQFFGRQRILKRLFGLLKRHPLQNAAIIGQRRSGKTSLLHYLQTITTTPENRLRPRQKADWLPNPDRYRWIFVDFQDRRMASRERLLSYLLERMRLPVPDTCDLDTFMDLVDGNINRPTVILMDEVGVGLQRCPELDDNFWESLRSLATNYSGGNLAFILSTPEAPIDLAHHTGHSSPFFNIFGYTATLGPLTEGEARQLMTSSPFPFAEDDMEWIWQQSGGWPFLVQILCRERLFGLEERETDGSWQDEGLQQMKQFRYLLEGS